MDHDRLFKELLGTFFLDFLRLFVPNLAAEVEEASLIPLDKEVFTDVTSGERHEVDLLVQARLRHQPSLFLIHVETQASRQADFARRMFRYFARLYEKHGRPVYPIALFSYDQPRRSEPDSLEMAVVGRRILSFHFDVIQLNRLSWRDFRETQNPVACALMARMGIDSHERPRVKWECYRLLATLKLDPAKTRLIGGFVNAYLELSEAEERVFQEEMAKASPEVKEAVMELTNPWIERGREEGRQEGEASLVLRLLTKRLGALTPEQETTIRALPTPALETLAEAVFEITTPAELDARLK